MGIQAKGLIQTRYAQSSENTEYTAAASTYAIIDKFTAFNSDSGSVTLTIHICAAGGAAIDGNAIIKAKSIAAGATVDITEMKNHVINPGEFVSVSAGSASKMVIRMSGREVT